MDKKLYVMKKINENDIVSEIIVQDLDGKKVNLIEKYRGQNLLIIIYNNQCLGCTGRAIPLAYDFKNKFDGLQVLGIHSNFANQKITGEDIKSIFTIDKLPFPIYIDKEAKVYEQFESEGTPQWVLINSHGKLYRSIFGSQEGAQNRLMYALNELFYK